jgi:trans-aconitate methyltransferase
MADEMRPLDELLAEQRDYYADRAGEYDLLFARALEEPDSPLGPQGPIARRLRELAAGKDVLDLACGTGYWSEILAGSARSLTAVDASEEMLAVHARRLPGARRLTADVLSWVPNRRYELAFFGFWLSHVPDELMRGFWDVVDRALEPGGTAAFMDSAPSFERLEDRLQGEAAPAVRRRLLDGREYRVIKVMREPSALRDLLAELGWQAEVIPVGELFLFGTAKRRRA